MTEEAPGLDAWDPWHPRELADRLDGLGLPWCVAAGWALDLFRGTRTRPHGDLEFAVPATGFERVAARFDDHDFYVPHDGRLRPATAELLRVEHQTWALDRSTRRWRFDVFREPHEDGAWVYRRDHRIRRSIADVIEHTTDGIPYLVPEIVLLFKAKHRRDKDEADFHGALPLLDHGRRRWLDDALALVSPTHAWRAALAGT